MELAQIDDEAAAAHEEPEEILDAHVHADELQVSPGMRQVSPGSEGEGVTSVRRMRECGA